MCEKIKGYIGYLYGLFILLLVALYSRQKKKTEEAESALEHAKADKEISLNEQARQEARQNAAILVEEYERLKNEE